MAINDPTVSRFRVSPSNNKIVNLVDEEGSSKTVRESGVDPESMFNPFNPDELYQKKGDYSIYEDMMKDDQVAVAMSIKKDLIIGSGWHIALKESAEGDEEIKRDVEVALSEDIETSFDDILDEILTAYEFGFSVSEKQFKRRDDGSVTVKNVRTRHPVSWLFHQDKFGNISRYEQQGTTSEFNDIDPSSLIHFVNNPRFGGPYGTSDLRAAYTAWFIKKQIIRFYAIFLEKAASPTPIGKYDRKIALDQEIQDLHNTLKKLQSSTALTIPKDLEVSFLEQKSNGDSYTKGINLFNMFIGRALFVPDLLGFQGGETTGGAQALGREQMKVFFKHIMRRRRNLENLVNHHLVQPLVLLNHGDIENFPKFRLNPIEEEQAAANAKLWLEAVKGRSFPVTLEEINHFKRIIDFPETPEEEMEPDPIDDVAAGDPPPAPDKPDVDPEPEEVDPDDVRPDARFSREHYAKAFNLPPGDYHKKTNFKAIENQLNSQEDLLMARARPVIREIFDKFSAKLRKMDVTKVNRLKKLEDLKLPKRELAKFGKILEGSLIESFQESKQRAASDLNKENFAVQPADEFLRTLAEENFNFINDWEFNVTKRARVEIIAAVKDGRPISSVIDVLEEDEISKAAVATQRYSRTKFTEVMNKGRIAFFKESGVVSAYQYSAILDDRTTTICRGLHGKIFKAGEEPVPPLHFNCRSVLVPITQFEEFKTDSKVGKRNIQEFIEAEKGKGFSKQ